MKIKNLIWIFGLLIVLVLNGNNSNAERLVKEYKYNNSDTTDLSFSNANCNVGANFGYCTAALSSAVINKPVCNMTSFEGDCQITFWFNNS